MPLSDDGIRPILTAVVRLKSYGKRPDDVHTCKTKLPHLLVLFPDAIQLFTTSDAGGDALDIAGALAGPTKAFADAGLAALDRAQPSFGRFARRMPFRTSTQEPAGRRVDASETSRTSLATTTDAGEADELQPGQVFRLGVALSQVLSVEVTKSNRLQMWYQPNRPSKKGTIEDQTMMVLRSILSAMDYRASNAAAPPPPSKNAHHFTIVCTDEDEALDLKSEIERAQRQLAFAVLWLSDGLPLRSESSISMITVGPMSAPTSSEHRSSEQNTPAAFMPVQALPCAEWNKEIVLPPDVGDALAVPTSRRCVTTVISVYLQTPLGRAVAEIPLLALQRSAMEGSAPMTTPAALKDPPNEGCLRPGKRWAVALQWRGVKGKESKSTLNEAGLSGPSEPNQKLRIQPRPSSPKKSAGAKESLQGQEMTETVRSLAGIGLLLLALSLCLVATLCPSGQKHFQVSTWHGFHWSLQGNGNVGILVGLAAFTGVAALVRRMRTQLARLGAPQGASGFPVSTPHVAYDWQLCLVDISIDEEIEPQELPPSSPPVKRSLSVSVKAEETPGIALTASVPTLGQAVLLPNHISLLLQQYPAVLTPDVARRFIVGLGSDTKAFAALSSMAQWTTENGYENILERPQPAFKAMKAHYPHGFPGWSKKKDCLVEIEAMGQWPRAYAAIAEAGVSEQGMLEHLLFIYQYAFTKLDARSLPHGKTVKIVDLEGLSMSDIKTPGFKLITRVGAMLSLNFPQRLHRCFLVNAPGWWAVAWRLISPIVPPKVRAQMSLFGKNDTEGLKKALLEWVDEDVLPVAYGGKNELAIADWDHEVQLAEYVQELNAKQERQCGGTTESTDPASPYTPMQQRKRAAAA